MGNSDRSSKVISAPQMKLFIWHVTGIGVDFCDFDWNRDTCWPWLGTWHILTWDLILTQNLLALTRDLSGVTVHKSFCYPLCYVTGADISVCSRTLGKVVQQWTSAACLLTSAGCGGVIFVDDTVFLSVTDMVRQRHCIDGGECRAACPLTRDHSSTQVGFLATPHDHLPETCRTYKYWILKPNHFQLKRYRKVPKFRYTMQP